MLRRGAASAASVPVARPRLLRVKELELDLEARQASLHGMPLELSSTEFRLLAHLMANAGRLLSREELLTNVWGTAWVDNGPGLTTYISYLRRKPKDDAAKPSFIFTVRGQGYCLPRDGSDL